MFTGKRYYHVRLDIDDMLELNALIDQYSLRNPGKQLFLPGDQILLADNSLIVVSGDNFALFTAVTGV